MTTRPTGAGPALQPAARADAGRRRRSLRTGSWLAPAGVSAVVAAAYLVFAAWQWQQFAVKSWDLSIFAQLLDRYSTLQAPIVTVKGDGFNLLGDHFHPLLALLGPIYAAFPHAFTLLVIQACCFAVAAGMFTHAARRRLGGAAGTLLGIAFGLSWGLQYAAEAQFHEIALAVPLLTASLIAVLEGRWQAAALWAAPLVFVKEDLGLTVAAVGALIAYRAPSARAVAGRVGVRLVRSCHFGRPARAEPRRGMGLCRQRGPGCRPHRPRLALQPGQGQNPAAAPRGHRRADPAVPPGPGAGADPGLAVPVDE